MGHFSVTLVFANAVIIVAYSVHSYGLTSDICIGDVFRCTSRNFHNLDETTSHLSQQNYPCWHDTCLSSTRLRFHHSHRSPFFSFRPPTPNATKYLFFGPNSGSPAYQVIIIVFIPHLSSSVARQTDDLTEDRAYHTPHTFTSLHAERHLLLSYPHLNSSKGSRLLA